MSFVATPGPEYVKVKKANTLKINVVYRQLISINSEQTPMIMDLFSDLWLVIQLFNGLLQHYPMLLYDAITLGQISSQWSWCRRWCITQIRKLVVHKRYPRIYTIRRHPPPLLVQTVVV